MNSLGYLYFVQCISSNAANEEICPDRAKFMAWIILTSAMAIHMESCMTFSDYVSLSCFFCFCFVFLHAGGCGKSCQSCQRCLQAWVSLAAHGCVPPWAALEPISRLYRERRCLFSCESLKQTLSSLTLSCFIKCIKQCCQYDSAKWMTNNRIRKGPNYMNYKIYIWAFQHIFSFFFTHCLLKTSLRIY